MIKRTCSNTECQKDLPLTETYFRKRANGVYRTDCRKCEAKGRADRRKVAKIFPPSVKAPVGARSTREVLDEIHNRHKCPCGCGGIIRQDPENAILEEAPKVRKTELNIDLSDPDSLINAINTIFGIISDEIKKVEPALTPIEQLLGDLRDVQVTGDIDKDYLIHEGVAYHAVPETRYCDGCAFYTPRETCSCSILHLTSVTSEKRCAYNHIIWKKSDIPASVILGIRKALGRIKSK